MVDLHVTTEGVPHLVVDAEGFAALLELGDVHDVHPVGQCPCPHQIPAGGAVTLLGFVCPPD